MSTDRLTERLVLWIKGTVSTAGGMGVVLGMSGGIDSAVAAAICKRAFPESTLGVIMPCYSDQIDRQHAELVAAQLNISCEIVFLDKVFDVLMEVLPSKDYGEITKRLAESNIKPRLRMVTLYYFANRLNYLVVGTSNRSELSVGYFTKHGDGGADLLPLGNLVKSQVYELAAYLEIPRVIIDKPPSAGLWQGQTDERQLGLTYKELDHYLLMGKAQKSSKKKIDFMISRSNHKRHFPPIPPLFDEH